MTLQDTSKEHALHNAGFTEANCAFMTFVWKQRNNPAHPLIDAVSIELREYLYDCDAHSLIHSNNALQPPAYTTDCVLPLLNEVSQRHMQVLLEYPSISSDDLGIADCMKVLHGLQKPTGLRGQPPMWQVLGFTDRSCRHLQQRPTDPAPVNMLTEYHSSENPADPISEIAFKFHSCDSWVKTTQEYINHIINHPHAAEQRRDDIADHYASAASVSELDTPRRQHETHTIINGATLIPR